MILTPKLLAALLAVTWNLCTHALDAILLDFCTFMTPSKVKAFETLEWSGSRANLKHYPTNLMVRLLGTFLKCQVTYLQVGSEGQE